MDQDEHHLVQPQQQPRSVAMYSSQAEFYQYRDDLDDPPDPELRDPQNRTALDAAVLENIVHANIHKLADLLHTEGSREQFMAWLWNLADFNSSGVVTLDELHVFLTALSEDGIDLEELAFYREGGVPLEECIINEFDTTHTGLLTRDEFMVLADLVTREYEFWENRHLERIGDYELGRTIGRGSSGVVRLACHVVSRQKVAIKIIKKGKCSDLSRLDREIQSLMAAKHKNIVALEEVLESESNLFIVMELCGGGSMVDIVRLYPEERMPEETARFFMRQVFEAIAFCHRNGICHRDIRLDNIMLDNAGNVKVTDFGHSGIYTPGWDLFSTSLVGSVYNLSPEQIRGQCYSGEKIDIWSAGVAVYCLLVGHPPFFDADVSPLLQKITSCDFEIPEFISEKAGDLIQCMIRAVPEERITIQQMLHHPWFYDGPEFGPSMDVVVIPLDSFYKKRPDIAEVILAMTIYEHNLHSHLADTRNPKCCPSDLRGQEWTLKCLCPKSNIKFSISLFTKEPCLRKKEGKIPATMSCSVLTDAALSKEMPKRCSPRAANDSLCADAPNKIRREGSMGNAIFSLEAERSQKTGAVHAPFLSLGTLPDFSAKGWSPSRPPIRNGTRKESPCSTGSPREEYPSSAVCKGRDVFDFERDSNNEDFSVSSLQVEVASAEKGVENKSGSGSRIRSRRGRHSRSHSLDESGSLMRLDRSATIDAFPYQKVYPQRKMPQGVEQLNFDRPDLATLESLESDSPVDELDSAKSFRGRASRLNAFHRSVTLHAVSSYSKSCELPSVQSSSRKGDITQKLCRHPSKAISPQSPQTLRYSLSPQHEMLMNDAEDLALIPAALPAVIARQGIGWKVAGLGDSFELSGMGTGGEASPDFQPYIELRRHDGESGLFLKVCRKFKTICTTKLAATAEKHRMRSAKRRSISSLRRTGSSKSIDSTIMAASVEAMRAHAL